MTDKALYKLMMEIDKHPDLDDHPIRESEAYKLAVSELGWDIDWDQTFMRKYELR